MPMLAGRALVIGSEMGNAVVAGAHSKLRARLFELSD
jgi:hypothetical protein